MNIKFSENIKGEMSKKLLEIGCEVQESGNAYDQELRTVLYYMKSPSKLDVRYQAHQRRSHRLTLNIQQFHGS